MDRLHDLLTRSNPAQSSSASPEIPAAFLYRHTRLHQRQLISMKLLTAQTIPLLTFQERQLQKIRRDHEQLEQTRVQIHQELSRTELQLNQSQEECRELRAQLHKVQLQSESDMETAQKRFKQVLNQRVEELKSMEKDWLGALKAVQDQSERWRGEWKERLQHSEAECDKWRERFEHLQKGELHDLKYQQLLKRCLDLERVCVELKHREQLELKKYKERIAQLERQIDEYQIKERHSVEPPPVTPIRISYASCQTEQPGQASKSVQVSIDSMKYALLQQRYWNLLQQWQQYMKQVSHHVNQPASVVVDPAPPLPTLNQQHSFSKSTSANVETRSTRLNSHDKRKQEPETPGHRKEQRARSVSPTKYLSRKHTPSLPNRKSNTPSKKDQEAHSSTTNPSSYPFNHLAEAMQKLIDREKQLFLETQKQEKLVDEKWSDMRQMQWIHDWKAPIMRELEDRDQLRNVTNALHFAHQDVPSAPVQPNVIRQESQPNSSQEASISVDSAPSLPNVVQPPLERPTTPARAPTSISNFHQSLKDQSPQKPDFSIAQNTITKLDGFIKNLQKTFLSDSAVQEGLKMLDEEPVDEWSEEIKNPPASATTRQPDPTPSVQHTFEQSKTAGDGETLAALDVRLDQLAQQFQQLSPSRRASASLTRTRSKSITNNTLLPDPKSFSSDDEQVKGKSNAILPRVHSTMEHALDDDSMDDDADIGDITRAAVSDQTTLHKLDAQIESFINKQE